MTGIEYEIDLSSKDPTCFIIRKQHRHSLTSTTLLALYFVSAKGIVYPLPNLRSVLSFNMVSVPSFAESIIPLQLIRPFHDRCLQAITWRRPFERCRNM